MHIHSVYMYFFPNERDSCPYYWRDDGRTDSVSGMSGMVGWSDGAG